MHGRCQHKIYRLTCAEYDRLAAHAAGRCQTCGVTAEATKHGLLVIDHDAGLGDWAVRGLLCSDCNTQLPAGAQPEWAAAYLAAPWWRVGLGLTGAARAEPPIGAIVTALPTRVRFRREAAGWRHVARYGGPALSWRQLSYRYAPDRLV